MGTRVEKNANDSDDGFGEFREIFGTFIVNIHINIVDANSGFLSKKEKNHHRPHDVKDNSNHNILTNFGLHHHNNGDDYVVSSSS
jgi:hypothetical protein